MIKNPLFEKPRYRIRFGKSFTLNKNSIQGIQSAASCNNKMTRNLNNILQLAQKTLYKYSVQSQIIFLHSLKLTLGHGYLPMIQKCNESTNFSHS